MKIRISKHGMMVIPHPISTLPTKNGSTETMAVLTYNLLSYSGEAIWKENYRKTAILHGTSHVFSKYFLNFVHHTC